MKSIAFVSMTVLATLAGVGLAQPANAESRTSFCGYIPDSPLQTAILSPCTYAREQDVIAIDWEAGDIHTRFEAVDEKPGLYIDEGGSMVHMQRSQVGADAQFRLEQGTVLVYWRAASQ